MQLAPTQAATDPPPDPRQVTLDQAAERKRQRLAERQAADEASRKEEAERQRLANNAAWLAARRPGIEEAIKQLAAACNEMRHPNPDAAWACRTGQQILGQLSDPSDYNLDTAPAGARAIGSLEHALRTCSPQTAASVVADYSAAMSALYTLLQGNTQ